MNPCGASEASGDCHLLARKGLGRKLNLHYLSSLQRDVGRWVPSIGSGKECISDRPTPATDCYLRHREDLRNAHDPGYVVGYLAAGRPDDQLGTNFESLAPAASHL